MNPAFTDDLAYQAWGFGGWVRVLFETLAHVKEKCAPPFRVGGAKAHFVNNKNRFNLFKKVFSLMALELASSHALHHPFDSYFSCTI